MAIRVTCDYCDEHLVAGTDIVELARVYVYASGNRIGIEDHERPPLLHWRCVVSYVQRRDAQDKEPPF